MFHLFREYPLLLAIWLLLQVSTVQYSVVISSRTHKAVFLFFITYIRLWRERASCRASWHWMKVNVLNLAPFNTCICGLVSCLQKHKLGKTDTNSQRWLYSIQSIILSFRPTCANKRPFCSVIVFLHGIDLFKQLLTCPSRALIITPTTK